MTDWLGLRWFFGSMIVAIMLWRALRRPGLRFGVWMSGVGMAFAVAILLLSRRRPADPGYRADR